jgi:hypothetical protein
VAQSLYLELLDLSHPVHIIIIQRRWGILASRDIWADLLQLHVQGFQPGSFGRDHDGSSVSGRISRGPKKKENKKDSKIRGVEKY